MHKEGLENYNDLIKYLFCFFVHLLDRIRKLKLLDYDLHVYPLQPTRPIKLQFPLFQLY